MRRSYLSKEGGPMDHLTPVCQETRWDPTKYRPAEAYGELTELFAKLRNFLGGHLEEYLSLLRQYIKQSLSMYELDKRIEKLLSGESLSVHDAFVRILSKSCYLITVSRSLNDILAGTNNKPQKDYIPHISSINALLILRSLENGWAAPDPIAGQLIGDAVRTMLADRIDAALHVRISPNLNKIGFRNNFSFPGCRNRISSVHMKNPLHKITTKDLFNSFSCCIITIPSIQAYIGALVIKVLLQVENHFLGAETRNLLRLKCHSNFYGKLKSYVEGLEVSPDIPTTSNHVSNTGTVEAVTVEESFSNLATAAAHTCISLPVTFTHVVSNPIPYHRMESPNTNSAEKDTQPASISVMSHDVALNVAGTTLSSVDEHLMGNKSAVNEPSPQLKTKPVKRRRDNCLEKVAVNDVTDSSAVTILSCNNKSARLDIDESHGDFAYSSRGRSTTVDTMSSANQDLSKSLLEHPSSILKTPSKRECMYEYKMPEFLSGEKHDSLTSLNKPVTADKMESKKKLESGVRLGRTALNSLKTEICPLEFGSGNSSSNKSGSCGITDKSAIHRAQAIIDAWKSSSYEVVPTLENEHLEIGIEKHVDSTPTVHSTTSSTPSRKGKCKDSLAVTKSQRKKLSVSKTGKISMVNGVPLPSVIERKMISPTRLTSKINSFSQDSVISFGTTTDFDLSPQQEKHNTKSIDSVKASRIDSKCSTRSKREASVSCSDIASASKSTNIVLHEQASRISGDQQIKKRGNGKSISLPSLELSEPKLRKSFKEEVDREEKTRRKKRQAAVLNAKLQAETSERESYSDVDVESQNNMVVQIRARAVNLHNNCGLDGHHQQSGQVERNNYKELSAKSKSKTPIMQRKENRKRSVVSNQSSRSVATTKKGNQGNRSCNSIKKPYLRKQISEENDESEKKDSMALKLNVSNDEMTCEPMRRLRQRRKSQLH
ncbi:hypothetical protein DICVIV_03070 [Dictyocaulus viviparus]|uniref:Uncharacterized protein n=1 Tax=Dictyocaulus viviparus TaxID=29172 RepID=A0A0D8Y412_DICVI|nr:hypothetical protein DICVIV_03070 [Dictyocaulus viviparus]